MGRAFVFGDAIDTDLLAPGHLMKLAPEALATHCLEAIAPTFAGSVRPGDVLVAGMNFGLGSSREQAVVSLKLLGVSAVLAASFARIFYRNAINLGLPVLHFPHADQIETGDTVVVDPEAGTVRNLTRAGSWTVPKLPPHLLAMIRDGGLIAHLEKKRIAQGETC
jgi:3-isopropylmalate/(R)-2-methylmalate dehydratase small subunit